MRYISGIRAAGMGGWSVLSVLGGYWLSSFSSYRSGIEGCCCSTSRPSEGRSRKHWFKSMHGPWRADRSHRRMWEGALLSSHRLIARWSVTLWAFARRDWIQAHEEGWQQVIRPARVPLLRRPIAERDSKCISQPFDPDDYMFASEQFPSLPGTEDRFQHTHLRHHISYNKASSLLRSHHQWT